MKILPHSLAMLAALLMAACGSAPPVPDWQLNAHGAAQRAQQAWLSGDDKVAGSEWARARAEVARTARPELMARLELMRCAAEVASLQTGPCTAFDALRQDAGDQDLAYADYLAGQLDPARVALLPEAQRAAAGNVAAIAAIADPLSRLVAAGAALRAGRATPETLVLATDTASAQGWRRPVLAWLLLREQRARTGGDEALADALQRRIALVQAGGAAAK
jgi:hypothetical protein